MQNKTLPSYIIFLQEDEYFTSSEESEEEEEEEEDPEWRKTPMFKRIKQVAK